MTLEIEHLSFCDVFDLGAFALFSEHDAGDIRDELSDHNFDAEKYMLDQCQEKDNFEDSAVFSSVLHEVGDCGRPRVLAVFILTGGGKEENGDVDGDRNKRDELHYSGPATNTRGTLGLESTTVLRHPVELDVDLEQVCHEREEGREWEDTGEEHDETKLNDGFVVEVDKTLALNSHD